MADNRAPTPRLVLIDLPKAVDPGVDPLETPFLWPDAQNIPNRFGTHGLRTEKSDPDSPFPLPREIAHAV
ncbi:hypothetical protein [Parasphingorhabdus pacifica]